MLDAQIVKNGSGHVAVHGNDSQLFVTFFKEAIQDDDATKKEGRPMFKDVDFIKINYAGNSGTVNIRPVIFEDSERAPSDPRRFPQQWAQYQNQETQTQAGTPLHEWAYLSKSQVMMLKAAHIQTVEALAGMADSTIPRLGIGGRDLVEQAKAYLALAKDSSAMTALVAKMQEKDDLIKTLEARLDALAAKIADDSEEQPAKRGRKKKDMNDEDDS